MYQAALEGLLGIRRGRVTFQVDPCIPAMWPEFAVQWRVGRTLYRITVTNPEHRCRGVQSAEIDGSPVNPLAIPLRDDGGTHDVAVVIGKGGPIGVATHGLGRDTARDAAEG